jgi:hypothetical protein
MLEALQAASSLSRHAFQWHKVPMSDGIKVKFVKRIVSTSILFTFSLSNTASVRIFIRRDKPPSCLGSVSRMTSGSLVIENNSGSPAKLPPCGELKRF